jgi:hypothetical protein
LSLLLPPVALAWFGRLLTWGLLAWAWRRLSFAVVPRPWWSILTAGLMGFLLENYHMAGEWIIGGVEAKGFAFVLVFLGLESLVRDRWNRAWLCFGAAGLFHVLVGGWSAIAAGLVWVFLGKNRPAIGSMWAGLLGGLLLAAPSLIGALSLDWGVDAETTRQADMIHVFERLGHHLNPMRMAGSRVFSFGLLMLLWAIIRWKTPPEQPGRRLHAFVAAAVVIGVTGILIALVFQENPARAAALLRFYWFRLADVAVPIGVALGGPLLIALAAATRPVSTRLAMAGVLAVVVVYSGCCAMHRPFAPVPRAALRRPDFEAWRAACRWVALPGNVPPKARFLTPRRSQTFKWYTGHGEVVTRKDVPQDARSIIEWWDRIRRIHATESNNPWRRWHVSLAELGPERLKRLGAMYSADYVLTVPDPPVDLPVVYRNRSYVIYRLDERDPEK